jgi:hypothetical protein
LPSLTDEKENGLVICVNTILIVGLLFLATFAAAVPSVNASNCVDIDCLKEKLRLLCKTDPKPDYLDCQNFLKCMDAGEQEIMRECVKSYSVDNESSVCDSQDLLARSWCDYA